MPKEASITAAILAGGKNSRIKLEKSLLQIEGKSLLAREIEILQKIFAEVILISSKPELISNFPQIKCLPDIIANGGPLAGIHTALKHIENPVFIFGCDMPYLNSSFIQRQIDHFHSSQPDALVPIHKEGIEPLHAIYTPTCTFPIEKQLKKKIYPVRSFFSDIKMEYFRATDKEIRNFYNINTTEDWQNLLKTGIDI